VYGHEEESGFKVTKRTMVLHARVSWACAFAWACLAGSCAPAAGNVDQTNKHAWAENAGWVNFAPTNGGVTVHFSGARGYLTGYAWGENIGWVKLGDNSGGPYDNDSSTDWGVNLDAAGKLSGYAWGENVGWVKFDPDHSELTIDMATGRFDGYAWGENIGWIRFQGHAPDYSVRTVAFDRQPLGTPNWWLALHGVGEDYDDGDGVQAWKEYVADTDPTNPGSRLEITGIHMLPEGLRVEWRGGNLATQYLQVLGNLGATSEQWSTILTNAPPTLTATNVIDAGATNQTLFYRIRAVR
jgi:hypothetical protein